MLGRKAGESGFSSLKVRADYTFSPSGDKNTVVIPVFGRAADVRLQFFGNTGAGGGQVAEFEVVGEAAPTTDLLVTDLTWPSGTPSEKDAITIEATVRNAGNPRRRPRPWTSASKAGSRAAEPSVPWPPTPR